ncbi:alpha-2-macroglobulin [Ideonella sp. A 288]|uniref:alpha-2-macroglobulin family protein n=1 Tax=Ideonella sp. A 288 TaxID=1962181 RepID=UPI001F3169F8|nr:MG2 domain-containing protein [Ideonella sp. A 288]
MAGLLFALAAPTAVMAQSPTPPPLTSASASSATDASAPTTPARISGITPQGEVAQVRQVVVRFSQAVVPLGDLKRPAPVTVACSGPVPAADGRWTSEREWVQDFRSALPPGVRCSVRAVPGWAPLQGTLAPMAEHRFSTGGPAVARIEPWEGNTVDEDQHFLLRLTGPAVAATVQSQAWCEVDGIGERIAVRVVDGPARQQVLDARRVPAAERASALLLTCARPLPAQAKLRLVWGPGIAAAADAAVTTRVAQRFRYQVRPRFSAEFSCEREKAQGPCMPLRPLVLRFSVPLPQAALQSARLVDAQGRETAPQADESGDGQEARFAAPLPENAALRVTLPRDLKDPAGRPLANAASFPLAVATGPMPPLAKFAAAPFGIVEWGPEAMLPVTLRHVQAELRPAAPGGSAPSTGTVRLHRVAPKDWLAWMGRLDKALANERSTRQQPMLTREASVRRLDLPAVAGSDPRASEVVGIPLTEPGYHVVEIESRVLGDRLLDPPAPMFVRTGVLVTNLGVHFKRGHENALAWVTTLDRARPVPGAEVTVHDCVGKPLWQGRTGADGLARIDVALADPDIGHECTWQAGYFVTASHAAAGASVQDMAFVFSSWHRGIEPWRFNLPTAMDGGGTGAAPRLKLHTVFDRTLLRVGETVSMKHIARAEVGSGLRDADTAALPSTLKIVHVGSGDEVALPLSFDARGRAALSTWAIPATAKLGLYDVQLHGAKREWSTGQFRVEAFRVPLVDARLAPPTAAQVAPASIALGLQLTHLAGGGVARAPVRTNALLRERAIEFPDREGWSFRPPSEPGQRAEPGDDGAADGAKLVVDRQAASTDAQGAATLTLGGLPKLTRPSELQVEVSFDDPNGERQTVASRVPLWPAARVVGVKAGSWAAAQGSVKFQALLLGLDGKPIANGKIAVQARSTQWQATRKRLVGGFYAYDQQATHKDLGTVCEGSTDARGLLLCEAALSAAGEVELVARSADEAGRMAESATTVWVTRQGELWFEQDNDDRIDVIADTRNVAPGGTARLQVRMPYRQATALVSVEREGVLWSRVVTLQGSDPVVEVPIPGGKSSEAAGNAAGASWAPNVYASVLVLRGRVRHVPWYSFFTWGWRGPVEWWRAFRHESGDYRAPTAMVDLARPSHKFGVVPLRIGLDAHRLDVKVSPDRADYRVRQTVKARVQVLRGSQPAAGAEIAFAAVDEGLLALMPNRSWALLEAMFEPRPWNVETSTAQGEIIGRRHFGRKAVPAGGGGGRNPTRELFDTLLLWRGSVTLDARGEALVEVPLNDSLSSFRLVAIASDGADRFGTGSASVRVTQDLQLLPGLPPVAREGDRFDAVYTLRNTTAQPMAVQATLAVTVQREDGAAPAAGAASARSAASPTSAASAGSAALGLSPQSVNVPAGGAVELRWPIEVPAGATRLSYEASAQAASGGGRDRVGTVQRIGAVVPLRVWQATLKPLDGTLGLPVEPPAGALPLQGPKAGGVQIGLQPTLAGALPGIRRYFETYPFSCLEQQASRALALKDSAAWSRLGEALVGQLDADGLALYYPAQVGDAPRGSDRLTAHLLAAAHEAGQPIPDAPRERMLQALTAFVEGRLMREGWSPASARGLDLEVRKLAALEALSRHGRAAPRHLQSITIDPNRWPTAAVIDWLRLLQRLDGLPDRAARRAEAMSILRARLGYAGTTLTFSTEASDQWWWLMDSGDANAGRLILAVVDDPAWKDELPRLVLGALGRQQRGAWLTTTANLWGALALERFARVHESATVTGRTVATLGTARSELDWAAAPQGGRLALPWPPQAGALNVTQTGGSGRPWLSVQALAAVPLTAAVSAGYRVTRSLAAVERKTDGQWTRGDIVRVRVEIDAQDDMTWVALNDPVPTGATLLGSGLGRDSAQATRTERREGAAWLAFEERAQDAYRASWEFMPRGRHAIEYTMRLNSAGRFALPPSRVEAMYAPDRFGELPGGVIEVRP